MPPVRTLYVMRDCDFPPKTGTPQRIWRMIQTFSKLGPIAVFSVGFNVYPDPALPGVERWEHVDTPWPDPMSRAQRLWEHCVRAFSPAQYRTREARSVELARERRTNRRLQGLIDEFQPTVAVLDHWLWAIAPAPLRTHTFPLIVSSHDVEWQLLRDVIGRRATLAERLKAAALVRYYRGLEARLYRSADRVWTVSERDRREVQRFARLTSQVRALPIVTEIDYFESVRRQTLVREHRADAGPVLFYAGAYWWQPNEEAADLLIGEIYPRLRAAYSGTRLILVGRDPTSAMKAAAARDDHIVVTGQVEDIRPYLAQSHISAVPLLTGGGMRSKIIEAFGAGLPVVSTSKGAEGIEVADGRELLIRDGVTDFVAGVAALWEDAEAALAMARRAFDFVRRDYSMEAMERRMRAEVSELLAGVTG